MDHDDIRILNHSLCYQGFFRLDCYTLQHRLFSGQWSEPLKREVFERGHAVAVLPYDPLRDEIVLIEQFRIGALHAKGGAWLTEIIAGVIDVDESVFDVVNREAREEAGITLSELIPICEYLVSPGGCSEQISLFCGRVNADKIGGIHGLTEEGEDIRVFTVGFNQAMAMLKQGKINSAGPIIALQWLANNREWLRNQWR